MIEQLTKTAGKSQLDQLTRREYALMVCGLGAAIFALLPVLLNLAGTKWKPGVLTSPAETAAAHVAENKKRQETVSL
jgi:hypothetical protein